MTKFLMVDPACYSVAWEINPYMVGNVGRVDQSVARRQWLNLRSSLTEAGAAVETVSAPNDMPDAVFAANGGYWERGHFLLSRFARGERQPEERLWHTVATTRGDWVMDPWEWSNDSFEGAGDALADSAQGRFNLYMGYGQRTTASAARVLDDFTKRRVVALKLVDPRFYHLDLAVLPLSGGHVLVYPPALDSESYRVLRDCVGKEWIVEVSEEDALGFALNAVEVGKCLFANGFSKELYAILSGLGYLPVAVPMSEFMLAGGGCRCLVLSIDD